MDRRVVKLLQKEQYKQKSQEWYNERKNLITASSASNLLVRDDNTCDPYIDTYNLHDIFNKNGRCCNPYSSKSAYIKEKLGMTSFKGNIATYWGQKYESVALDLYSLETGKKILDFGLIKHDTIKWLASSPDGITNDGIMVEIKCPYKRKITGIPPFYYWIQVQLQLEVCNLDFCDFVEYEFMEFNTEEEFLDEETLDLNISSRGIMIRMEKITLKDPSPDLADMTYLYPDKEFIDDTEALIKWKDKMMEYNSNQKFLRYIPIYWKVVNKSIVRIERSFKWFQDTLPVLQKEYTKIFSKKEETVKCIFEDE